MYYSCKYYYDCRFLILIWLFEIIELKKNCIRDLEEGEEVPVTSTKSAFIQFKYKTRVYIDEEH